MCVCFVIFRSLITFKILDKVHCSCIMSIDQRFSYAPYSCSLSGVTGLLISLHLSAFTVHILSYIGSDPAGDKAGGMDPIYVIHCEKAASYIKELGSS